MPVRDWGQSLSLVSLLRSALCVFFFNDTATTEIYTLSLHDALPIFPGRTARRAAAAATAGCPERSRTARCRDRKSTRLNSSHQIISYAVFCLKKKKRTHQQQDRRVDDRRCRCLADSAGARHLATMAP